jgi:class 3 adenylate cyclase
MQIETIGDAYMVAAGLLVDDPNHAATLVRFAAAMQQAAEQVAMPNGMGPVQIRVGIHSGPLISGVIGQIRKRYCLVVSWGMMQQLRHLALSAGFLTASPLCCA